SPPAGDLVSEPVPNSTARADVLPADGGEPVACSPTIPPKRRRGHKAWLKHCQTMLIATGAGRGAFKAVPLLGAFVLIVAIWFWDASLLMRAAGENLRLLQAAAQLLPPDWPSHADSALRIFGSARARLRIEGPA